jgi:hypothetical protein
MLQATQDRGEVDDAEGLELCGTDALGHRALHMRGHCAWAE